MSTRRIFFIAFILFGLLLPLSAQAGVTLTVTPLTWNTVGLDSNSPAAGPYRFPVGARVCNTGTSDATDVQATFYWDDTKGVFVGDANADPNINLRAGSLQTVDLGTIAAGNCSNATPSYADAYFEVQVTQAASAYDTVRKYYITATDSSSGATGTSARPRQLYVEHLISQNRNGIDDVKLNGTSVPAGGSMDLFVGNTYTIELDGHTATQGYNQLESFINFPNTIFQILSVSTTYSADSDPSCSGWPPSPYPCVSGLIPNPPSSLLYADACGWDNDPGSPNYRSCVGGDYKAGGTVVVTYTVKIIGGGGTNQTLGSLFYDFSGSSFHYNSDYSTSARVANVLGPSSVTISKTFAPATIAPNGSSTMTITLTNPTATSLTGVNFNDAFPGGMSIELPLTTTNTCGGTLYNNTGGTLAAGDGGIGLSGGTLSPGSSCTITANVTSSADGSYLNTTGDLFINTSTDTGNTGSATLTVSSAPPPPSSCATPSTLATWTMPVGSTTTPPAYTTKAADVSTATASASLTATAGAGQSISTTIGNPVNSWLVTDAWSAAAAAPGGTVAPYFSFLLDTSNYGGVTITFDYYIGAAGDWASNPNQIYVYSGANGATPALVTTVSIAAKQSWYTSSAIAATSTGTGTTQFTLNASTRNGSKPTSSLYLDNIIIKGCPRVSAPTLTKSFSSSSVIQGNTSTLTFTFTNPNSSSLTGVAFSDSLPAGLLVNTPSGLTVPTCTSGSISGQTVTADAGSSSIQMSGATLAANSSCSFSVDILGKTAGQYTNTTGNISATESGTNTAPSGYGVSSITVNAPPVISKTFTPSSIFIGESSTLTFTITNPNQFTTLNGISFSDDLPAGITVADSTTSQCGGTNNLATSASTRTISLTGGSLDPGSSCTFSIDVTAGSSPATINNTTSAVTSTNGGSGNTASATLLISNPLPLIGLNKQISTDDTNWYKYVGVPLPFPQNVYYRFTVSNDGEMQLNNVAVTDPDFNMASCIPSLPSTLNVGDSADCVIGPVAINSAPTPNPFVNTAAATTSTYTPSPSVTSSAKYGTESLSMAKSVTESSFTSAGTVFHYSYLVTNTGGYPLLGPVTVSDDKTTVICPDVSTVGNNNEYLDPGESITCTATYTVTSGDMTVGYVTNTASATVQGVTSNTDSKTVPEQYTVTTNANNGGITSTINPTVSYDLTTTVTGSANPNYYFTGVSGCGGISQSNSDQSVTTFSYTTGAITANCTVTANFSIKTYTVTANATGNGTGTVSSNTGSISYGYQTTSTGTTSALDYGTNVVLTASAGTGSTVSWTCTGGTASGNGTTSATCTYSSLSSNETAQATFTLDQYTVTANATGNGTGTVSSNTGGISYSYQTTSTGTTSALDYGTNVVLTANAGTGSTVSWTCTGGTASGNGTASATCTYSSLTGNETAQAAFTLAPKADLSITKTSSSMSPAAGADVTFTLTVTNNGPSDATGVSVTDILPSGLQWQSDTSGGAYDHTTGIWTLGSLANGASASIDVTVKVMQGGRVGNVASITASDVPDPDLSNNSSALILNQGSNEADLAISKTVDNATPNIGDTITYTVTVTNNGPDNATGVAVTDTLPAGILYVSDDSGGSYNSGTGVWTIGSLNAGTSKTLHITATVTASGEIVNTASITASDQTDPDITNNQSSAIINKSAPSADLSVQKTVNLDTVSLGDAVDFTIIVRNNGPDDATNVAVADVLPAGLTYQSYVASEGSYDSGSGTWAIGTIKANSYVVMDITAQVTTAGLHTNTAAVSSDTADPDTANDSGSADVTVNSYTLTVTKTGNGSGDVTTPDCTLNWSGNVGTCTVGSGTSITLTGTADPSSAFGGWANGAGSVSCTGTGTCTFTLTQDSSVEAPFTLNQYTVTANAAGNGTGTVSSNTGSISYTYQTTNTGTTSLLDYGTNVVLTANAGTGSTVSWTCTGGTASGNGTASATCTYSSLSGNETAQAAFTAQAHVFDPPMGLKTVNGAGYPQLSWQMVWINNGNASAELAEVVDPIPAGATYVQGSLQCLAKGSSTTSTCSYDSTNNRVIWQGNIAPDPGATNANNAPNAVVITFKTTVTSFVSTVRNQACANWDSNDNGSLSDEILGGQTPSCTNDPAARDGGATVWNKTVAVPTLNVWGIALTVFLMMGVAVFFILRRPERRKICPKS